MLRKVFTYSVCFIILTAGLLLNSCATPERNIYHTSSQRFLGKKYKPKVIQLSANDCPWDKSFIIKNVPKQKVYDA